MTETYLNDCFLSCTNFENIFVPSYKEFGIRKNNDDQNSRQETTPVKDHNEIESRSSICDNFLIVFETIFSDLLRARHQIRIENKIPKDKVISH